MYMQRRPHVCYLCKARHVIPPHEAAFIYIGPVALCRVYLCARVAGLNAKQRTLCCCIIVAKKKLFAADYASANHYYAAARVNFFCAAYFVLLLRE